MKIKRSKIALGTVQFGLHYGIVNLEGKTHSLEVSKILNAANSIGIRLLDTAQAYGDSEKVIGRLHENRFQIITKINPVIRDSRSAEALVRESLDNLNVNSLYGLLFHNACSAIQNPKIVAELKDLQERGIIQKIGFSVYTIDELNTLISRYGMPDIVQIPFSHLDQRFERIAIDLHNNGVEIHSRSTFLQGLYFVNQTELPQFFGPVTHYLNEVKKKYDDTTQLAQALLNFCLSKDYIDYVVIGINNEAQLINNINAFELHNMDLPEAPRNISEKILMPNLWPNN